MLGRCCRLRLCRAALLGVSVEQSFPTDRCVNLRRNEDYGPVETGWFREPAGFRFWWLACGRHSTAFRFIASFLLYDAIDERTTSLDLFPARCRDDVPPEKKAGYFRPNAVAATRCFLFGQAPDFSH